MTTVNGLIRMNSIAELSTLVAWLAFGLAFIFGAVANKVDFCTMGAVSDIVNMSDWRRMNMWLLAIAVAIAGAHGLQAAGLIDLGKTFYTTPQVNWLSHALGGMLFGFGMTLASGCGSKTLIRAGAGNLKSIIVLLFLALSAYMTLKGLFAFTRVHYLDAVRFDLAAHGMKYQDLSTIASMLSGLHTRAWLPYVIAGVIILLVLINRDFRTSPGLIVAGIVIGAVIVGGWAVSGKIGYIAEHPQTLEETFVATNSGRMESYSFTSPVAYTLELLLLWSDQSRIVTFGIAGVLGMALGSTAMALFTRRFRWEGFTSKEDLVNHATGGILMGFGGVTALGCTIGQGLTGISTLAIGAVISFFSLIVGSVIALKYQYWRANV